MIINGNCLDVLKTLSDNSVDSVVTDPPYGLKFMSKKWDYDVPKIEIWQECLRVLKPGGYLLSFAGTRTQHRMAVRIEDAGFEIRDMIAWIYGSGFPKSLNIGKAVDKLQGNEQSKLGSGERVTTNAMGNGLKNRCEKCGKPFFSGNPCQCPKPKYDNEWEGWGTALKPALEPITVARKPIEGTVAENCLKWGVGGVNIDGSRVETTDTIHEASYQDVRNNSYAGGQAIGRERLGGRKYEQNTLGRFPANLIHDGSDEVVGLFPNCKGWSSQKHNSFNPYGGNALNKSNSIREGEYEGYNDSGSAARFFYCAKASKSERNQGCEPKTNFHPTVKPIALMEYLIKLVSKEGHTVLDPFMGSGSTGIACKHLGREFIGIELDPDYFQIAKNRINKEDYERNM